MAINLTRRLSSLINISCPKLALSADIASRLVSSSAHHHQQNKDQLDQSASETKTDKQPAPSQENDSSDDDDVGGEYFNKETGEIGGPKGPEPTRFGDWEKAGRCSDF